MSELELLLRAALTHDTCSTEKARIAGDAVVIPFDVQSADCSSGWTIQHERVRSRRELLDVLGYG